MFLGAGRKKYVVDTTTTSLQTGKTRSAKIFAEADTIEELLAIPDVSNIYSSSIVSGWVNDLAVVTRIVDSDFGQCVMALITHEGTQTQFLLTRNHSLETEK